MALFFRGIIGYRVNWPRVCAPECNSSHSLDGKELRDMLIPNAMDDHHKAASGRTPGSPRRAYSQPVLNRRGDVSSLTRATSVPAGDAAADAEGPS